MTQLQVWCLKFSPHEDLLYVAQRHFYHSVTSTQFSQILQYF